MYIFLSQPCCACNALTALTLLLSACEILGLIASLLGAYVPVSVHLGITAAMRLFT